MAAPGLVSAFAGPRRFFVRIGEPLLDRLEPALDARPNLDAGGTVAHLMFAAARALGTRGATTNDLSPIVVCTKLNRSRSSSFLANSVSRGTSGRSAARLVAICTRWTILPSRIQSALRSFQPSHWPGQPCSSPVSIALRIGDPPR